MTTTQYGDPDFYYIAVGDVEHRVSREDFISVERTAGFQAPKGQLATSGFSNGIVRGRVAYRPVVQLDRPDLEEDRYLVLLDCGHWVHTRAPDAERFPCPVVEPPDKNDGMRPPATTPDGERAILTSWELYG